MTEAEDDTDEIGDELLRWSTLSTDALSHVWDNDADAAYDQWYMTQIAPEHTQPA